MMMVKKVNFVLVLYSQTTQQLLTSGCETRFILSIQGDIKNNLKKLFRNS